MFSTVLYNLRSPGNTGILVRAHVALGGDKIVAVGPEPWVDNLYRSVGVDSLTETTHLFQL